MLSLEERRLRYNIPNDPILAKNKTLALNVIAPDRKASVVHAYIRVSTLKQQLEGQSLDTQEEQIREYCRRNNVPGNIILYPEDAVSGRVSNRKEFSRMLNNVDKGDVIITYSLSRLGRNMHEILDFLRDMKNRYITVICLKENFNIEGLYADMFVAVLAAITQVESDLVRDRAADAMHHLKQTGQLRPKPKFGYKYLKDGTSTTTVPIEEQQQIIIFILALITGNPRISDAEITRSINHEIEVGNLRYKGKSKIYQVSVRNIINNNNLRSDTTPTIQTETSIQRL